MRSSFNAGWWARPKASPFAELRGPNNTAEPVTLPHDAVIGTPRDPSGPHSTGYFPGGVWEYTKAPSAPPPSGGPRSAGWRF